MDKLVAPDSKTGTSVNSYVSILHVNMTIVVHYKWQFDTTCNEIIIFIISRYGRITAQGVYLLQKKI